jgi:hypothetical protein
MEVRQCVDMRLVASVAAIIANEMEPDVPNVTSRAEFANEN